MRYAYFYPACYSLYAKKRAFHRPALFFYGWGTWIRTKEMPDSESGALPLGYTPMTNGTFIILYENVPVCQPLFIKITKVSAFTKVKSLFPL